MAESLSQDTKNCQEPVLDENLYSIVDKTKAGDNLEDLDQPKSEPSGPRQDTNNSIKSDVIINEVSDMKPLDDVYSVINSRESSPNPPPIPPMKSSEIHGHEEGVYSIIDISDENKSTENLSSLSMQKLHHRQTLIKDSSKNGLGIPQTVAQRLTKSRKICLNSRFTILMLTAVLIFTLPLVVILIIIGITLSSNGNQSCK